MSVVHLNGAYMPKQEALVPVDDRGFLFSDGVYEVTPAYRGRFFRMERHLARLSTGLCALRIPYPLDDVEELHRRLLEENGLADSAIAYVYLQVTRGVAPRTHAFPKGEVRPTVYAFANAYRRPERERWEEGFSAVTVPDRRWTRADLKTISLLPNVLAQQSAVEAGVDDAILVRDGVALEGSHNNFFAVFGETVVTHPTSNHILPGITREYVLELARDLGMPVEERPIQVEELERASELFFTGTTTEVRPTVRVNGAPVGDGRVGPVTKRLYEAFIEGTGSR
jgi:D-alanine transaminase